MNRVVPVHRCVPVLKAAGQRTVEEIEDPHNRDERGRSFVLIDADTVMTQSDVLRLADAGFESIAVYVTPVLQ